MGEELSEEDIADMIKRADADQDGVVSKEEFYDLISGHRRE